MALQSLGDYEVKGQSPMSGQLSAPNYLMYGHPSLNREDFGQVPSHRFASLESGVSGYYSGAPAVVEGCDSGCTILSPGERRPTQLQGALGVPGQPGTGALLIRPDLGSIPDKPEVGIGRQRSSVGERKQIGFIGSIASMFFGRKGGLS